MRCFTPKIVFNTTLTEQVAIAPPESAFLEHDEFDDFIDQVALHDTIEDETESMPALPVDRVNVVPDAPRRDPEGMLFTHEPMNNWRLARNSLYNRTSRMFRDSHGRPAPGVRLYVRSQHKALRKQAKQALLQLA